MVNAKGSTKKSNLDRFLHCTTPLVPPQSLPKVCPFFEKRFDPQTSIYLIDLLLILQAEIRKLNRLWHPWDREKVEFFRLSDLWDCYDEWSAYGASVPIHLANGESLVQYYVPYLSAIQIFTSHSSLIRFLKKKLESLFTLKSCLFFFIESWCFGLLLIREESEDGESYPFSDSGSDESVSGEDGVLHLNDRLGYLYLQYFERSAPYTRVPLMDKVKKQKKTKPCFHLMRARF